MNFSMPFGSQKKGGGRKEGKEKESFHAVGIGLMCLNCRVQGWKD
jgi:hypothetical protein